MLLGLSLIKVLIRYLTGVRVISNMNETVQRCITFIGVRVISNMNETVQQCITFIGVRVISNMNETVQHCIHLVESGLLAS